MRWIRITILAALTLLAVGSSTVRGNATSAPLVTVVRVPDGGIHPQAVAGADGVLHLVYFKGEPMHGDAFYVRSRDGGATFSMSMRVNSHPGSVIVTGTVRGPHLAVGKNSRVHVAWMGSGKAEPKGPGKSAPMLYTRLNDNGDAFEPQRNLIRHRPGLDGGGSVAADEEGNVYVAWHAPLKGHTEEDRHVWVVRSKDEGRTFGAETMADSVSVGVCACCGMRVAAGPGKGEVHVLYRSARKTVNRDVQLLASTDYGDTFTVASSHPWKAGQCMMSTSSFSRTADGILAAWETRHQVYFTRLKGTAAPDGEPTAAPGAGDNRKHPVLAASRQGQFVLAWSEGTGWDKGGKVAWQVFDGEGKPMSGGSGRRDGLPAWSVPAAVAMPDGSFRIIY